MSEGTNFGFGLAAKRRHSARRRSRQSGQKRSFAGRVSLEKVLGISAVSGSSLATDSNSGLIAYPAGCIIVLLHPKKNKQSHIVNTARKPFSAVAFSHNGKHLVTGESGHMPCVRVWEVGAAQVAEVQSHKYGVSCVAFSSNSSYIVSVGFQHDMTVSVWDWRKGSIIATNKVSSRVCSVSFSQDDSFFVTAGSRHVKFWYLGASKERRVNSTVPLIGRSGLLGEHKNSVFSGVACGRGQMASNVYCITSSGLLCLFSSSSRQLEAWVNLQTSSSSCLSLSEDFIFCGCADGLVRVFSPSNLQYISTLQRPHRLGVELSQSTQHGMRPPSSPGAQYPNTVALTFDPAARLLTCVYNDHSLYVWDVRDVRSATKLYSALYHSGCVWGVEVYPELLDVSKQCLHPSSFLTCSSDNTIRLWNMDAHKGHTNLYSNDLLRILYVGDDTQHLQMDSEAAGANGKAGIRVLGVSPDGRHLAAGDRCGNLRIFSLEFLDELMKIEGHDSEVLCLEFSPLSTGVQLLASASRDRLIHVFNVENNFSLEQTLNDHSASITAVRFTGERPGVRMVSCGADKSVYFQTAEQTVEGLRFCRSHHVVEKSTLNDMDLDQDRTHVVVACQDRNVRVYNVETGKLKKCLRGSSGDEGAPLKVQVDPSGSFFATSCSDKNINIFDYKSGECVATLYGHSEIVTCMRFSQDCRHLITVSGDSCVFVWRLDPQMTSTMRKRRGLRPAATTQARKQANIRRETFISAPCCRLPQTEVQEEVHSDTPDRSVSVQDVQLLQTDGKLPQWFRKLQEERFSLFAVQSEPEPPQVRCRWAVQASSPAICSAFSPSPTKSYEKEEEEEDFHPQSPLVNEGDEDEEVLKSDPEDQSSFVPYPEDPPRELGVQASAEHQRSQSELEVSSLGAEPVWTTQLSLDSACSAGSTGSLDQQQDPDMDSLSQGSSVGGPEKDEDQDSLKSYFDTLTGSLSDEKFHTDPRTLRPPDQQHFLNPRLSISTRFLSRYQDRLRGLPSRAMPPAAFSSTISEESDVGKASVTCESSGDVSSAASSQRAKSTAGDDVNSTTLPALNSMASTVQQGAPRFGYRETTASSRATLSHDASSTENMENFTSCSSSSPSGLEDHSTDLPEDRTRSLQAAATPTRVMSQGGVSRCSMSSVNVTLTNQNRTLTQSPAFSATPVNSRDIISQTASEDQPDSAADWSVIATPTSSRGRPERPRPLPTDEAEEWLQWCERVAGELKETTRRAVHFYQQLCVLPGDSERRRRMASILRDAQSELQAAVGASDAPCGRPQDDATRLLLEEYSELLVQMTRDKLERV